MGASEESEEEDAEEDGRSRSSSRSRDRGRPKHATILRKRRDEKEAKDGSSQDKRSRFAAQHIDGESCYPIPDTISNTRNISLNITIVGSIEYAILRIPLVEFVERKLLV